MLKSLENIGAYVLLQAIKSKKNDMNGTPLPHFFSYTTSYCSI